MQSRNNIKETSGAMSNKNRMTEELIEDIESHYPKPEHFAMASFKNICKRGISVVTHHCSKMSPKDCIFASSKKIEQDVSHLCTGWRAGITGDSKMIKCHYQNTNRKK